MRKQLCKEEWYLTGAYHCTPGEGQVSDESAGAGLTRSRRGSVSEQGPPSQHV